MKIRSFARKTIALALLSVAATGANASTPLGTANVLVPLPFIGINTARTFDDIFTFTLPENNGSGYSLIGIDFQPLFAIDLTVFSLFSNIDGQIKGFDIDTDLNNQLSFSVGALPAGSYSLGVVGSTLGELSLYYGAISVTAVPEPESYALFLAGLGIMGAVARRRNKAKLL